MIVKDGIILLIYLHHGCAPNEVIPICIVMKFFSETEKNSRKIMRVTVFQSSWCTSNVLLYLVFVIILLFSPEKFGISEAQLGHMTGYHNAVCIMKHVSWL